EETIGLLLSLGEFKPIAPLPLQPGHPQTPQQHIIGRLLLWVQLQPGALKPLRLHRLTLNDLLLLRRDREAKYWQPAVLLPEAADTPGDTEARLGKAALLALPIGHAGWPRWQQTHQH